MTQDEDHLRLLSIFHYVVGGVAALFALLPVLHLIFGLFIILAPEKFETKGEPPQPATVPPDTPPDLDIPLERSSGSTAMVRPGGQRQRFPAAPGRE